jgi:nicotinamidase-related amidase
MGMDDPQSLTLRPETTALVLIDLQHGIVGRPELAPYSGDAVVERAARLAERFRGVGAAVVLVNVAAPGPASLKVIVDKARAMPPTMPANWDELVPALGRQASDIRITKRQWGAFYGTELDLQLRRRRIDTIVLGGIATAIGVESTARAAYEHGYNIVFVEDAMTSTALEMHRYPVEHIFPAIGRVRSTVDVLEAFGAMTRT